MAIPIAATRCPYCRTAQEKVRMWCARHAAAIALMMMALVLLMWAGMFAMTFTLFHRFTPSEPFAKYRERVRVVDSQMEFVDFGDYSAISVSGCIDNCTSIAWEEAVFQVEFFNAEGQLVDAEQEHQSISVPANFRRAFEIQVSRCFPRAWYASHTVRVVYAEAAPRP